MWDLLLAVSESAGWEAGGWFVYDWKRAVCPLSPLPFLLTRDVHTSYA